MKNFLQKIGRFCYQVICSELFIVASHPFPDRDKWKILYGTRTSFRFLEFSTFGAANQKFDGIRSAAAHRFDETVCDLLLLNVEQTRQVMEGRPFAEVIGQAMEARAIQRKLGQVDLLSELI